MKKIALYTLLVFYTSLYSMNDRFRVDSCGRTPLHHAAIVEHPCPLKAFPMPIEKVDEHKAAYAAMLILMGIDIRYLDNFGHEPLYYAYQNKKWLPSVCNVIEAALYLTLPEPLPMLLKHNSVGHSIHTQKRLVKYTEKEIAMRQQCERALALYGCKAQELGFGPHHAKL